MIKVENLSYSFPQKDLYNEVSFTIEPGQHCAFIGTSGSGKSTLIDIIMNPEDVMFKGNLEVNLSQRIGCVTQFSQLDEREEISVFDYIAKDFIKLQKEIADICVEMETATELDELLERYQLTLDSYEAIGGDSYENQINASLNLADLARFKDLDVNKISGGEFKLVQIIKELLTSPELIIMDEPDVFLDFHNLNGLRKLLNNHKGTLLVITHNRYLLDHCFNKVLHLENEEIREFDGRFAEYNFSLLQAKIEQQELATADDEEIIRNEAIIERLRERSSIDAEKARGKSLKARVKIQERLINNRTEQPFVEIKRPEIDLSAEVADDDEVVLKVEDYHVAFDEPLLENVSFEIGAKDKVALIGPNGTGKTTLMRDLVKNDKASIQYAEGTEFAYLSQDQGEVLDEDKTALQAFMDLGFETYDLAEAHLKEYGFNEEQIRQTIGSLSGGEKNILQIAMLSYTHGNLLLLDEPTSHLDTFSQIALEEAIKQYNGAVLMISHDYYSIANCMDYVLIIEDKTIRKMKLKKFKRMIYKNYFDKDYLSSEEKKKAVETKIALALKDKNFELARELSEDLEAIIKLI